MPGGAIIVVMTRWSKLDLTGQIVTQMERSEEAYSRIVQPFETWKSNNAKPIHRPDRIFDSLFTEAQKRYIRENLIPLPV